MKILYGVQATGNGHIARARVMARAFERHGLSVDFLLSGRSRDDLFGAEAFGDFEHRRGLTFDVKGGRVRYLHTALKLPLIRAATDIAGLDVKKYDLVVSDFEPVTAWAARLRGVPSLGISHQCAFCFDIPKDGGNILARTVLSTFAPVRHCLGLHWDPFGFPLIPPLIDLDDNVKGSASPDGRAILVYLPFESETEIMRFLEPFPEHRFTVYMGVPPARSRGHISFRNYDKARFQIDLMSANGVICNAGFELPSECIHLGKRLLVKPVYGQMEQLSNARALTMLGFGHRLDTLDHQVLKQWLVTPVPAPRPFDDVAGGIVEWILHGDFTDTQSLSDRLWSRVAWRQPDAESVPSLAVAR
jgi:uncharacterized protein (TIGR00661 family)